MRTIHILHHGWPLCQFTEELPCDWPWGHVWISALDGKEIASAGGDLCAECAREHERAKAAKATIHPGAN